MSIGSRPLRGALIGAGYFAGFQADGWRRIPGVEMVGLSDRVPERARPFADRWGIPRVYADPAELLDRERPDFVDIATGAESHLTLTSLAAERGVNVICQRPLAPTWGESVAVAQAAKKHHVRLIAHEN